MGNAKIHVYGLAVVLARAVVEEWECTERSDNLFGMKQRSVRSVSENGFENGSFFFTFALLTIVRFVKVIDNKIFMKQRYGRNSFHHRILDLSRESKKSGDYNILWTICINSYS